MPLLPFPELPATTENFKSHVYESTYCYDDESKDDDVTHRVKPLVTTVVRIFLDPVANFVHHVPYITSSAVACPQFVPRAYQVQLLGALVVRPTLVAEHPASAWEEARVSVGVTHTSRVLTCVPTQVHPGTVQGVMALHGTRHEGETGQYRYSQTPDTKKNNHRRSSFTVIICRRFLGGLVNPPARYATWQPAHY